MDGTVSMCLFLLKYVVMGYGLWVEFLYCNLAHCHNYALTIS